MNEHINYDDLFNAVKNLDLKEYFRTQGYNVRNDGKVEPNPLRSDDDTPSFSIKHHRWHDFGTGEGGDLIDYLEATGFSIEAARLEAARVLNIGTGSTTRGTLGAASHKTNTAKFEPVDDTNYTNLVDAAHEALLHGTSRAAHQARAYLKHRGFDVANGSAEIMQHAKVGVIDETVELPDSLKERTYRDRIVFPYLNADGRAVFFNSRAAADVEASEKFRKPAGTNQVAAFLRHAMPADADYVVLVEAEVDALSVLAALGLEAPVLAAGGGKVEARHLEDLLPQLEHVLLLYDADDAGKRFARDAHAALKGFKGDVRTLTLPADCKDVNDALRRYGAEPLGQHLQREIAAARRTNDARYITTTYLEELQRRHERPHVAFPTDLKPIDALLGGGYIEGLHVLGGITGGGKTSFALRLALRNALAKRPVLYATFEQSKVELWSRIAAGVTRIPYGALKRGTYNDHDGNYSAGQLLQQHEAFKVLQEASEHLIVLEAGDALSRRDGEATVDDLHRIASRMKRDAGMPPLVVIDYLQRVPGPSDTRGRDPRERVGAVAGFLQVGLARDLGAPVLALSSIGRESYGKLNGKVDPTDALKAVKESGEIEYTAYSVALLTGFEEGAEPPGFPGISEDREYLRPIAFHLAKNREGETGGPLYLEWKPARDEWEAHSKQEVPW